MTARTLIETPDPDEQPGQVVIYQVTNSATSTYLWCQPTPTSPIRSFTCGAWAIDSCTRSTRTR